MVTSLPTVIISVCRKVHCQHLFWWFAWCSESQTVSTCWFLLGGSGLRLVTAARFVKCKAVLAPVVVVIHMLLHFSETSWEMLVCWGGLSGCPPPRRYFCQQGGLVAWWVIDLSVMTPGHSYGDECVGNEHYISMFAWNCVGENLKDSCLFERGREKYFTKNTAKGIRNVRCACVWAFYMDNCMCVNL